MQILVVEDEPRMAELLERTLSEEGHQVVLVGDGHQGFDIARSSAFDVILLDVALPGMDGLTVARKLRELRNQTPVLMLTARDAAADIVTGLDSGADDYLTKPFSIDVLLARLRAVSRRGAIPQPVCPARRKRSSPVRRWSRSPRQDQVAVRRRPRRSGTRRRRAPCAANNSVVADLRSFVDAVSS